MTGPSCVAAVALDTERQLHLMRERDDLAVLPLGTVKRWTAGCPGPAIGELQHGKSVTPGSPAPLRAGPRRTLRTPCRTPSRRFAAEPPNPQNRRPCSGPGRSVLGRRLLRPEPRHDDGLRLSVRCSGWVRRGVPGCRRTRVRALVQDPADQAEVKGGRPRCGVLGDLEEGAWLISRRRERGSSRCGSRSLSGRACGRDVERLGFVRSPGRFRGGGARERAQAWPAASAAAAGSGSVSTTSELRISASRR